MHSQFEYQEDRMRPFLIPYVTAGNGHRTAAMAVREAFQKEGIPSVTVDVLNFADKIFRMIYSNIYEIIGEHSHTSCGAIYRLTDQDREKSSLLQLVDRLSEKSLMQFRDFIKDNEPPAAVCTHFLPQAILCNMKLNGQYDGRIYSCITDFDLHQMWVCQGVDKYFVANELLVNKLRELGVKEDRVCVSGIPVLSKFGTIARKRPSRGNKWRMKLLISASSVADKKILSLLESMNKLDIPLDIDIITGRNDSLYEKISSMVMDPPMALKVHGFVNNMEELMAVSDLMISKPGGLTISEALCAGLPMLLISPIPFQETRNATFVETHGAGLLCRDLTDLLHKLSWLYHNPSSLMEMRDSCCTLACPMSAGTIAARILTDQKKSGQEVSQLDFSDFQPTGTGEGL